MLRHLVVPKPKLGDTAGVQPRAASLIALLLRGFTMLAAIKLNRQAQLRAIEIQNVSSGRVLPSKFEPVEAPGSELAP